MDSVEDFLSFKFSCSKLLFSFLLFSCNHFKYAFSLFCFSHFSSDRCNLASSGEKHPDTVKLLDKHLESILENVRLNYLLERDTKGWDANVNWEDTLSLGEQQRLGMVC
jgi:hypothetical protein